MTSSKPYSGTGAFKTALNEVIGTSGTGRQADRRIVTDGYYIYVYIYIYVIDRCTCVYIHIYIERERERDVYMCMYICIETPVQSQTFSH